MGFTELRAQCLIGMFKAEGLGQQFLRASIVGFVVSVLRVLLAACPVLSTPKPQDSWSPRNLGPAGLYCQVSMATLSVAIKFSGQKDLQAHLVVTAMHN